MHRSCIPTGIALNWEIGSSVVKFLRSDAE